VVCCFEIDPDNLIDIGRRRSGVMAGKRHRQARCVGGFQGGSTELAVVPVAAPSRRERKPQRVHHRRQRSADRSDGDLALADVVEERRREGGRVVRSPRLQSAGNDERMTLVGGVLAKEQGGKSIGQGGADLILLDRRERPGTDMTKEATCQMEYLGPERAHAGQEASLALQSTQ
jgi:hypothetical protein